MYFRRAFLFLILLTLVPTARAEDLYAERYRPQFHFSPRKGWIGDPDGLIRYRGEYHLFWWGHATSTDLVHWKELPYPMAGGDGSFEYFTGSVVVDKQNTSGYGTATSAPMVAVYTAHDRKTGFQTQRLSSSTDYTTFHYVAENPVLDIGSKAFRDPDVFWHTQTKRWIMAIASSERRKIQFYGSADLKSWKLLSEFGPVGARSQLWEVPNIFQLSIKGETKWILMCGMGPNRTQYFKGNFDGNAFTLDPDCEAFLTRGIGLEGTVFADFPAGDPATGRLLSPAFKISKPCINFLIAGGNHPGETCINLLVDGAVVQTATGNGDDIMRCAGWNVSPWKGKSAQLEIKDRHTGKGGHISVDHIMFGDVLRNTGDERANWLDYGPDFYAARTFRNYDDVEQPMICLGWMGNWDYARDVPTSWGRGAQSLPRTLELVQSAKGFEIRQQPLPELQKLRGKSVTVPSLKFKETIPLKEFRPTKNTYELEAVFELTSVNQTFGLNLCAGGHEKVVIGYEAATSNLFLDRRQSGNVAFNPHFPKRVTAPLSPHGRSIKFHIFIDQSSVEVFVNGGQVTMTSLIFPDPAHIDIELFSSGGETTLRNLSAWELNSIWR